LISPFVLKCLFEKAGCKTRLFFIQYFYNTMLCWWDWNRLVSDCDQSIFLFDIWHWLPI